MPYTDYWTPKPYDYEQATRGLAEKLQGYMDSADAQVNETVAEGIRGTAIGLYESWRHFSIECGKIRPEDDARCRKVLRLSAK